MLVLGINFSNDSAATIVRDGVVLAASQEERFTRQKHDSSFPSKAIDFCLARAGATLADVDSVAFFWNPGRHAEAFNWRQSSNPRHHLEFLYNVPNYLLQHFRGDEVDSVEQVFHLASGRGLMVQYLTHHLCHAASALFCSPFEECAILTVDGYGERASTHWGVGRGIQLETLGTVEFPHSIGSVYAALTEYLGFRANSGEGKVMGLASYGSDAVISDMRELFELTADGFRVDLSYFSYFVERGRRFSQRLIDRFGPPRSAESELTQHHMDVAHALQVVTEEVLLHLAGLVKQHTGQPRLAMAGGVVLNCVANRRIMMEAGFEECYFVPASSDAGTSMGAALYATHCLAGVARPGVGPVTEYLGASFDDAQVRAELDKAAVRYRRLDNAPSEAAERVAQGKIIGWFQGAAEFGPRALGNRSIVADPRRAEMKDIVNARVKFREGFRPFAPSCLESACGTLFDSDVPSPFMLRVYHTLPERRDDLAAITHIDGGARVQTVNSEQNPRYHALISRFGELTGVPCVLNTSFNIRGEPIVNTPAEALKCFYTTDMDALFIGDYLVETK